MFCVDFDDVGCDVCVGGCCVMLVEIVIVCCVVGYEYVFWCECGYVGL